MTFSFLESTIFAGKPTCGLGLGARREVGTGMSSDGGGQARGRQVGSRVHPADQELGGPGHQAVLPRRGPRSGLHARPPAARWWCRTTPAACSPPTCWSSRRRSTTSSASTGPSTPWRTTAIFVGPLSAMAAPRRRHRGQPRERREGVASRRGRAGVPRRRLRLVPADLHRERDRLRRPHRLRPDRDRDRRADRADGVDRRAGNTVVPRPRRLDGAGGWV